MRSSGSAIVGVFALSVEDALTVRKSVEACDSQPESPCVAFVSKMFAVPIIISGDILNNYTEEGGILNNCSSVIVNGAILNIYTEEGGSGDVSARGEHVLAAAGEVHLERCINCYRTNPGVLSSSPATTITEQTPLPFLTRQLLPTNKALDIRVPGIIHLNRVALFFTIAL
ncbi:hypothetical protein L2E82_51579 [Cichorium intybus]|nr:hypothetical protein L2E82_51579 [Cichorium intybus]